MTTSPERSGASPWYCSHESSRAATSTMVAAGLVALAALMAFIGLLVAGDEVSALVAAMVMLVAGANTWSAGRSRTWWRAVPTTAPASRPRPAPFAPSGPRPRVAVPGLDDQGHVGQGPGVGGVRGVPVAVGASRSVPGLDDQGHVRQGPRAGGVRGVPVAVGASRSPSGLDDQGHVRQGPGVGGVRGVPVVVGASRSVPGLDDQGHVRQGPGVGEVRGVPVAAAPTPTDKPAVVRLAAVAATPARAPQPARTTSAGPAQDVAGITTTPHRDAPDGRTTSSATGRPAPASATRARRRTAPVRPVSRRVAGPRSS